MFTRLFVLLLLALATVSVSTPARASTLDVWVWCQAFSGGTWLYYDCQGYVSGGTGTYTSYVWAVQFGSNPPQYYHHSSYAGDPRLTNRCTPGGYYTATLTVTDSAGATASSDRTPFRCLADERDPL